VVWWGGANTSQKSELQSESQVTHKVGAMEEDGGGKPRERGQKPVRQRRIILSKTRILGGPGMGWSRGRNLKPTTGADL